MRYKALINALVVWFVDFLRIRGSIWQQPTVFVFAVALDLDCYDLPDDEHRKRYKRCTQHNAIYLQIDKINILIEQFVTFKPLSENNLPMGTFLNPMQ